MGEFTLVEHLRAGMVASGNYVKGLLRAIVDAFDELDKAKADKQDIDKLKNELTSMKSTINFVPTQSGCLTYNGVEQSPVWYDYSPNTLTIGGTTRATKVGTYTATFTPKEGYQWADGGKDERKATWKIDGTVRPAAEV